MAERGAPGSLTFHLVLVTIAVCLGSTFQMYSLPVLSNLVEVCQSFVNQSFHDHYGHHLTKSQMTVLWSLASVALQSGALVGSVITRCLADRYGRRRGLVILSVGSMTGAVSCGLAKLTNSFELFIIGRLLIGVALGGSTPLASMFLTEIAPVRYRGACAFTLQLSIGIAYLIAHVFTLTDVLGSSEHWPIAVSVPPFLASATQFLLLHFYARDSPRALVLTQNDADAGLAAVRFYQGKDGAEDIVLVIKNEKRVLQREKEKPFRVIDLLFKQEFRRPLVIAFLIVFGMFMGGGTPVAAYTKSMFGRAGLDGSTAQYASIGLGLLSCLSASLALFLIERLGRKPLLLGGLLVMDVSLISFTVCLFGSLRYNWSGAALGAIPCLYIFFIGYSIVGGIVLVAPPELFHQKVRASAMSVLYTFLWAVQVITVMGYLPFAQLVGVCYSYFPFIISMTLSIVLLALFMPETKGKTVEQIAAMFIRRKISLIG